MIGVPREILHLAIPRCLNIRVTPRFRSAAQSDRPVDGRRGVWIAVRRDRPNERSVRRPTVADRGPALLRRARPRVPVLFPRANQGRAVGRRLDGRRAGAQQPVAAVRGLRFRALRLQTGVCLLCENGPYGNFNCRALNRIQ
ncbi:unnamed protein product [Macrosiphum euphorbiae]|uniref:Uncharacterized protein n=1 Tax=Macrosiphum euphorbiae TaxID=13131 RepID=A0AAV0VVQ0_9HEMI|nr:unnamed protein product [Macrosiphum euphorbiae]